ncbi:hypothetical protein Q7F20_01165 [Curtobacterium sp. A7_M15]|uniref:hypothetical protein n=1 Tax=Curtobacterium sp. A7_M15 TaxID=3065241 RepID=UPI002737CAD0|nr:hypothetical protein [Curtobacterium sp. A7_M15]MDP4331972.1 hypothetical protein [Curtobacterium sp. A7_M15]
MQPVLHAPRARKRSIAVAVLGALALVASLLVATMPAHALNDTGTGGVFVPATGRILDTKTGTGGFSTPMEAGKYRTIKVAGLAGLPDDGSVGAVSLNATVGGSAGAGTLFGRPDANSGRTTMLIYSGVSGEYTSNSATVAVGADGTIQVMTENATRLILDVQGYYTANTDGTAAGGFVPVAKRIVDTRSGLGAAKSTIAPGKSIDVQITGSNGIPSGASGVVVNLLPINSTDSDGYLTPYATGGTKPQNSLHYAPSVAASIQAQVPLSSDGKITIANSSSTANLVIDLQGYFTAAGTSGAIFTPSYGRAYDSRATGNTALAKSETRSIQIAGKAGVPVMGSGITAVTLTLIVSHAGSAGYAQAYADGATNPGTTAINFQADDIRTNTITVPLGTNGKIALRNVADATNYVVDVQGWYSSVTPAKITCGSVAAGAWLKSIPIDGIDCTISAKPADHSDEVVSYTLDDGEPTDIALSETQPSSISLHVPGTAGRHVLSVDADQADGTVSSTVWFATFGDWTTTATTSVPDNSDHVSLTPQLEVWADDVALPNEATYVYRIWDQPDTTQAPVSTSDPQSGGWSVPSGLLVDGGTYYWSARVEATLDGQTATLTTVPAVFVADSSVSDAPGAPDDAADYTAQDAGTSTTSYSARATRPTIQLASSGSVQGPRGSGLLCNKHYHYSTFNATFDMQRACGTTKMAWGFQVSVAFCSGATSSATELGMQIWDHTNRTSNTNSDHVKHCTYFFHGTMSGIIVGHQISYYDNIKFRAYKYGQPGTAYVDTSGIFIVTDRTK